MRQGIAWSLAGVFTAFGCSGDDAGGFGVADVGTSTHAPPQRLATSASDENPWEGDSSSPQTSEPNDDSTSSISPRPDLAVPRFDLGADIDATSEGGLICSADLQSIVWEVSGRVAEACAPHEGCVDGACVPACVAAAGRHALGCEFVIPTPAFFNNERIVEQAEASDADGACHAVWLSNTWSQAAQLSLLWDDQDIDVGLHLWRVEGLGEDTEYEALPDGRVPAGTTALLLLSHRPGVTHLETSLECPRTPAVEDDLAPHGTGRQRAFALLSDTPLHVQDILPYGGARSFLPSASVLHPVSAWGTNYLLSAPTSFGSSSSGRGWISVTASEDDTDITVALSVEVLPSLEFDTPTVDEPAHFTLARGDTIQFMSLGDLTGTIVEATAPIAVEAGHTYLAKRTSDSHASGGPRDAAHQQIPSIDLLASRYIAPGIPTRRADLQPEAAIYRVMATTDGSLFSTDPPQVEPFTLDRGQVLEFEAAGPFVVESDGAPFSLSQYMAGAMGTNPSVAATRGGCFWETEAGACPLGDTDWIHLVAPQHFSTQFVFAADPTYGVTSLALIRDRRTVRVPIELSCDVSIDDWIAVGESGFEVAYVDLFRSGSRIADCGASLHRLTSDVPFGMVLWGLDRDASYGFAAAGPLHALNDLQIPAG